MRKFNVKVNGQAYEVEVEEISGGAYVAPVAEAPVAVAAAIPAPVAVKPAAPKGNGITLPAPMPGTILELKVSDGTAVKKGQAVIILEAMKMENEIAASADGIIKFAVSKGASVNTGDVLATIE